MQIENESQWNTDDLKAITKEVFLRREIQEANLPSGFLLFFKTRRKHDHRSKADKVLPPSYAARRGYGRDTDGRVVEIYSKERLIERNLLDRIVQSTANEVQQDIKPNYIIDIAKAIVCAVEDRYSDALHTLHDEFLWAGKMQLRALPKIERSPEIIRRKIAALEVEKGQMTRRFATDLEAYNAKIKKLMDKLI